MTTNIEALATALYACGLTPHEDGDVAERVLQRVNVEKYALVPLGDPSAVPSARNTDPRTSRSAAPTTLRAGTHRYLLLEQFALAGDGGLTDEEAMERSVGISPSSEYAKRCSELREVEWLEDTGTDRPGNTGLARIVSRITDKGRQALGVAR